MSMIIPSAASLVFNVERKEPELIQPAAPTPYEFKFLSDIDDQKGYRKLNYCIHFYAHVASMQGRDPVQIIREALAKTLIFYYPFAGRLKEGPNEKLMVECTGEGVIFVEANANVRLEQFGEYIHPPFPCVDELLYHAPDALDVLHSPLMSIQVTRLLCGGFVVATGLNHTMTDALGSFKLMTALGEIARGASIPFIQPVWERELLNARNPPRVTCAHPAYDQLELQPAKISADSPIPHDMSHRSFFFGPQEIASLRNHVPAHSKTYSRFDLLTACIWRCRTLALNIDPKEEVRVVFPVNAQDKFKQPLPAGFYGNGCGKSAAVTTSSKLCQSPFAYAVELIREAKNEVTEEFMKSLADLFVSNGRLHPTPVGTFAVSDLSRIRFRDVDFGWGKAAYGGPTWGGTPSCFFISSSYHKVEDGILVTMDLPELAMTKFALEIKKMTEGAPQANP